MQLDLQSAHEAYTMGEVRKMTWNPGTAIPADALTRIAIGCTSPLRILMQTNKLVHADLGGALAACEKENAGV